jgi:integrase
VSESQSTLGSPGDNVTPLSPPNRKAKPCMAKRSGQSGTIVPKGNWWHLRYLADTPDGRIYKSVPIGRMDEMTKTQAKRLGKKYLDELGINTPQHLQLVTTVPTFAVALQKWEKGLLPGFKPSGQQSSKYIIRKHIKPKFGGTLLEEVNKQAVQEWINKLEESGLKPKTVSNIVKLLKSILNWSDIGTRDWRLRLPQIPEIEQRWFTAEEVEKIVEAAEGQYKVLFRLAYHTGCRCGELFALRVEDFNFARGTVSVVRSAWRNLETTPKSGKSRTIYLDSRTLMEVEALLNDRTSGRLFMTRDGTPLKSGDVNRDVLKPICKQVGIPVGTMHAFRHGRVSAIESGGTPKKIIKLEIGHSSLRMTERYTHFTVEQRKATAEKLAG